MPIPGSSVAQVGVAHSRSSVQACWIMHPNFLIAEFIPLEIWLEKYFHLLCPESSIAYALSFAVLQKLCCSASGPDYTSQEKDLKAHPSATVHRMSCLLSTISISFLSSPWYPRCMHTLPAHAHTHTVSCTHKYKATIKSSSLSQNKTISFSPKHTSVHINIWHQCPPNDLLTERLLCPFTT